MDRLEHGIAVAHVGAARRTHAALNLGSLVGDDIAVEVGQQHHLKLLPQRLLQQIRRHDVDVVIVHGDAGIVGGDLMADGSEFSVGLLHDVGLGDHRHVGLAVVFGVVKGGSGNAAGAQIGSHLEVHRHAGQLHAPAAQNVLALGILPEEHPVDVLFGDTHGTAVGVQIQLPAHGHVGALHFAAHGGGGGAFQQHVAGLDLRQNVVGNGLAAGHAVLNGQALDLLDNNGTGCNFFRQQLFQHTGGLRRDDGADAVAVNDADGDLLLGGKIRLFPVHVPDSLQLLLQQLLKRLTGKCNFLHYCPPSFV